MPNAVTINMPGFDAPGKDQYGDDDVEQAVDDLRDENLILARVAIGGAAGDGREQKYRNRLNTAHQTQLQRRVGQLVEQPAARHLIHPGGERREDLAEPDQTVFAIMQRLEYAQSAE